MKLLLILATAAVFYGIAGVLLWLLAQSIGLGPTILIALGAVSVFIAFAVHEVNSAPTNND